MLRPEFSHQEILDWAPASSGVTATRSKSQRRSSTETGTQTIDGFLERLVPEGLSANKRAIIERLITRHLQETRYNA